MCDEVEPAVPARKRYRPATFRGYVEAHGITWEKMWRALRMGTLPVRVGQVATPMTLRGYARAQGVNNMRQIRRAYREGLLPPLVGAWPQGRGQWTRSTEVAGLAVLYNSATTQLRSLKRALDLEAWRLADDRTRARERHKRELRRLRAIARRVKLFEGALKSRDVVLTRLKHEIELGRSIAGADKTVEVIVKRAMGAEAWEAMRTARDASKRRELAARIRAEVRNAERREKAVRVNTASAMAVEPSNNGVSHHEQ